MHKPGTPWKIQFGKIQLGKVHFEIHGNGPETPTQWKSECSEGSICQIKWMINT